MAAGTVFLDVDDEITSAAARIRSSETTKVALVVPYGSRISTSRMNFRLLSREAVVNNRRLSIVAADAATRALAASAGLPVFATVAEYEAALAGPPTTGSVDDEAASIAAAGPVIAGAPIAAASATVPPAKAASKRNARRDAAADETQAILFPTAAAAAAPTSAAPPPPFTRDATRPASSDRGSDRPRPEKTVGRPRVGTPVLAAVVALILALAVIAVGGYVILPAADITVTPSREAIGPMALTITADPTVSAVDTTNGIVPADQLEIPVDVTETFTTTGRRTELKPAKGSVTFSNYDPTSSNTISAGSIVSTEGGIRFKTLASVTLPRADFNPALPITPSKESVAIQAVKDGTNGNVPANAIRVVPQGENPEFLKVNNPEPTSGGAKNEFPRVDQKDIDAAVAALKTKLDDAFTAAVAAGAGAPAGRTLFPETAALGVPLPSPDPLTLIGQEIETFDLGMSAKGTVIAVDASPVQTIAQSRLLSNVGSGYRLVDGSIRIDQGDPVVTDGVVTFPVTATATRVRIVDPDALRAMVKGQSVDQARALLTPYGEVLITTWPGWVSSITGLDSRLTVTVDDDSGSNPGSSSAPGASTSPSASATSTAP
jgi:hypothetical protein